MEKNKNTYVKRRHKFFFAAVRPIAYMIAWKYHFRAQKLKLKKGDQYLILSNHQGVLDPVLVALSFKMPIYFVTSDTIFTDKWYSKLLRYTLAPIKKRKSETDINCVRTMRQIAKEGGSICMFPEANRCWCDFQFHIDKSICKMIRMLKMPVVLYNLHGLYGANPRWSDVVRKGKSCGLPQKVLTWEEICNMSDEELHREVVENLKVIDSDSEQKFRSSKRAEDLERLLFVCPECGKFSTLHSNDNKIACSECGYEAEYGEDLLLHHNGKEPSKLVDWYKKQLEAVKNHKTTPSQTIFRDKNVQLWDQSTMEHVLLQSGEMFLDDCALHFAEMTIPLNSVSSATCVGGRKLVVNAAGKSFAVIGDKKFNPVKYVLFFNVLCEQIAAKGGDEFYALSIDDANC